MMHKKNFVCAIKVEGKVLRELGDRVELPFGSEYSVLLKNLDTVRTQARISIDGTDAVDWVIVNPNSEVEIERFLRIAGSSDQGHRFKFIERTARIEDHRGIKADDGLVRVEFRREKVYEPAKIVEHHTYHHHNNWPYVWPYQYSQNWPYEYPRPYKYHDPFITYTSSSGIGGSVGTRSLSAMNYSASQSQSGPIAAMNMTAQNDVGITTKGSISNQRFISVAGFECEAPEVIVLHLVGRSKQAPIMVAKTVDQKPVCEICGKKNKATSKFCVECGASLEKV
jgi:hypothetical protein